MLNTFGQDCIHTHTHTHTHKIYIYNIIIHNFYDIKLNDIWKVYKSINFCNFYATDVIGFFLSKSLELLYVENGNDTSVFAEQIHDSSGQEMHL